MRDGLFLCTARADPFDSFGEGARAPEVAQAEAHRRHLPRRPAQAAISARTYECAGLHTSTSRTMGPCTVHSVRLCQTFQVSPTCVVLGTPLGLSGCADRHTVYRLRIGDIRVFYDVTETQVEVLAIVTKAEAEAWLDEQGTPHPESSEGGGAGPIGRPSGRAKGQVQLRTTRCRKRHCSRQAAGSRV